MDNLFYEMKNVLTRFIHVFNFEANLGTSPEGI